VNAALSPAATLLGTRATAKSQMATSVRGSMGFLDWLRAQKNSARTGAMAKHNATRRIVAFVT